MKELIGKTILRIEHDKLFSIIKIITTDGLCLEIIGYGIDDSAAYLVPEVKIDSLTSPDATWEELGRGFIEHEPNYET